MSWFDVIQQEPALVYLGAILLGLIVGSFLNVLILRLPRVMEADWRRECAELQEQHQPTEEEAEPLGLAYPPSRCPHCGHRIRAYENIPVISYLLLRGRCAACKGRISPRYPIIELATAVLSVIVVWQFGPTWQSVAALVLTWGLIALAVIDLDTQLLPDDMTQPLLWLGLIANLAGLFTDIQSAVIGAVGGYLSLWTVAKLFSKLTGKEGMGHGDFKLFALFGAWLGWQQLPQIILLSALTGALIGIAMIALKQHDREVPIPFGPYLAAAGWISLMWGGSINQAYLTWSGLG